MITFCELKAVGFNNPLQKGKTHLFPAATEQKAQTNNTQN